MAMDFLLDPVKRFWKEFQPTHPHAALFISIIAMIIILLSIIVPLLMVIPGQNRQSNSTEITQKPKAPSEPINTITIINGDSNKLQQNDSGNIININTEVNIQ